MVQSSRFKHSPWNARPLKMGPVGSPETPRHIAEEQRPQTHGGGNLIPHSVIVLTFVSKRETSVAQCLRLCATNRKVAGSISAGVAGNFH